MGPALVEDPGDVVGRKPPGEDEAGLGKLLLQGAEGDGIDGDSRPADAVGAVSVDEESLGEGEPLWPEGERIGQAGRQPEVGSSHGGGDGMWIEGPGRIPVDLDPPEPRLESRAGLFRGWLEEHADPLREVRGGKKGNRFGERLVAGSMRDTDAAEIIDSPFQGRLQVFLTGESTDLDQRS